MANKHRGYVEIELDKPRTLRFDLNALAELEEAFDIPLDKIGTLFTGKRLAANVRKLLLIGLKHEDESLTEKQVGAMIDGWSLSDITAKINEAFGASVGNG